MRRAWSTALGMAVSLMLAAACQESDSNNSKKSKLSHDTNDPVRSEENWNWTTLSKSQFVSYVLQLGGRTLTPVSEQFSDLERRARYWVELFDNKLRAKYSQELANVPKPQVLVITEKTPNAFISAAFACVDINVRLPRVGQATQTLFLNLQNSGEFSAWPAGWKCLSTNHSTLTHAIEAFNQRNQACQIQITGQTLRASQSCTFDSDIEGIASASRIVIPITANWMTIHAGLFTAMPSERAFIGVIAHELGHYYRSHITSFADEYDFFYRMGHENPSERPKRDLSLASFGKQTILASRLVAQTLAPVSDSQALPPETYLLAGSIAEYNCSDGQCPTSCQQVAAWENSSTYTDSLGLYPFSKPADTNAYFTFEQYAKNCLSQTSTGRMGEVSYSTLSQLVANPIWIPFANYLNPRARQYIQKFYQNLSARLPDSLPENRTAFDWVQRLATLFAEQHKAARSTLSEAAQIRLGYYTTEQEADEIALEWLSMLGFRADAGVEMFLALAGNSEDQLEGHALGGRSCKTLHANNWRDQYGRTVFVPVGDYDEIHHSSCFRAYNADREILSHKYPSYTREPRLEGLNWAQLQQLANSISPSSISVAEGGAESHPVLLAANHYWKDCPLAHAHK